MKKLLFLLFILLTFHIGKAQTEPNSAFINDSVDNGTTKLLTKLIEYQLENNLANRYKIYPTENIYILIKLDTQTGQLELIQWALKSEKEFTATLNDENLSIFTGINSFELYPTKNMYQFILLDKASGRSWHVQWGTKASQMWIRRIY